MKETRSRRGWLKLVAGTAPLLAGCSGGSDVKDSDGDGVIDSEDYAPSDPSVQAKSDLKGAASTASPTPADTGTPTSASTVTTSSTPGGQTADGAANAITVDATTVSERTFVHAYSGMHVDVTVRSHPKIERERAKLLAISYTFPRKEATAYGTSDPFTPPESDGKKQLEVEYDRGERVTETRLHHLVFAMPADMTVEQADSSDLTFLYETDPFRLTDGSVEPDEPSYLPGDDDQPSYTRKNRPGYFSLEFEGSTQGNSWVINFIVWKSAYAQAHNEPRGRDYSEYVSLAAKDGIAGELAELLSTDAESNGFTGKREKVELVIDFVQGLPYVTDDVSKGADQYTKMVKETIVEAQGDCEDTSILLCAVLQAEPFGYDMVLIQPPGHMAAGIYGTDLSGAYWERDGRKYYYIETTGESWGVGDIPDRYRNEEAYVHQV